MLSRGKEGYIFSLLLPAFNQLHPDIHPHWVIFVQLKLSHSLDCGPDIAMFATGHFYERYDLHAQEAGSEGHVVAFSVRNSEMDEGEHIL